MRRLALGVLLACLAVGLPLQALSSTLAGLLGPRHEHRTASSLDRSDDPMAGWQDFRRASYEHAADALPGAHAHAHNSDLRHRHDPDDASVIGLEAPADGDSVPAELPPVGAGFVMAANANHLKAPSLPVAAIEDIWRTAVARSFADPFPRRIERPPCPC